MKTKDAYNHWSSTYDQIENKTRDLEKAAGLEMLADKGFDSIIEIGCGTGKNTQWLLEKTNTLTAVDFSPGMLAIAKEKINSPTVKFVQADITETWHFPPASLVTASLVLEHIENIDFIFKQASASLLQNGFFYVCELHPYKQLEGSRAKFNLQSETVYLEYFIHHISDFYRAAAENNFNIIQLNEYWDNGEKQATPRLIAFLFQKK